MLPLTLAIRGALTLLLVGVSAHQPSLDTAGDPILLPPYPAVGFRSHLTGSLEFSVEFREHKLVNIELLSEDLDFEPEIVGSIPARSQEETDQLIEITDTLIKKNVITKIMTVIRQWRSSFVKDYVGRVVVDLELSDALELDERSYRVKFNNLGIVERLVITGPAL